MDADQRAGPTGPGGPGPLRRNRDFNLLWAGQAISSLGSQISVIAYPLLILAATGSAAKAGLVGGASLTGTLLLLLPAGVVADHYPRRRILIVTSLTQMTVAGTVVPAALTGHVYIAHLAAVGFAQGAAGAFYTGASRGAVRRIVPASQLREAMAATQARDQAAALLGPPAGGALFGLARSLPFAADAVSFGAIAAAAALLRTSLDPQRAAGQAREPLRRAITTGLRFLLGHPYLRTVAIWAAAVNTIAAGMLLMVIVLARSRGATPVEIGALLSINAACGLAGAVGAPRLIRLAGGRNLALLTSWLLPACGAGIAFARWVWLIGVLGAVTTFTVMPVNVLLLSFATQITPDELQAQSGNALQLCSISLSWAAPPVFGALTDRLGPRPAILIAAGLYAVTAGWLQASRSLRLLDEPPGQAAAAAAGGG
ncbi:MAG TPA: MFS transporter [Streptosporangiaceae bacterium]